MSLRTAFVLSLAIITTPLFAQEGKQPPSTAQDAPRLEEAAAKASEPVRKLRLITDAVTQNYIPKYVDGAGNLGNSMVYEDPTTGLIGIGLTTPSNALHVRITDGAANVPLKLETSGADSITGLSLKNDARNWHVRVDGTDGDKFKIYDSTTPAYRLTIDSTGRVGIGTTDPKTLLHLYGGATSDVAAGFGPDPSYLGGPAMNVGYAGASYGRSAGFINVRPDALAVAPNPSIRFSTADVQRMIITNTGAVGIGTTAPVARLQIEADTYNPGNGQSAIHVKSPNNKDAILGLGAGPSFSDNVDGFVIGYNGAGNVGQGFIGTRPTTGTGQILFAVKNSTEMTLTSTGLNVTDGLNVGGNIVASGNITGAKVLGAVYQDVAEWVSATTDIEAGTVVVLNPARSNEVMTSTRAYDTRVAGVVSAQPGILLGVEGVGKEQIATTGRVKVRVDARNKAILVGDLLVTSETPGLAMLSEPMNINGRLFHQPGTIIGKALEPLEGGVGEILVLLSMQ